MMANVNLEFEKGNLTVDPDAIAAISGYAASMSYGVVGMAYRSKTDSVASLLKKENFTKGIKVNVGDDNKVSIDIHVIIEYGINIRVTGKSIVSSVKYQVKHMTGLEVEQVNVYIEGFRVQGQE